MKKPARQSLLNWYQDNRRPLPWRENPNPYSIWLSETMLQQTTIQVVIPYYEKFLALFPRIETLACAQESKVLKAWAGLGYYSRARNLHRAAKALHQLGYFPQTYGELLKLPGFGPYTSRAVSSIAFGERVGVLDGNVIRLLSRYHGKDVEWWKPAGRQVLQDLADKVVLDFPPGDMNQAMMDLGSTICSKTRPLCALCPLHRSCLGLKQDLVAQLPRKKPRKAKEVWVWEPEVWLRNNKVALHWNESQVPFLKKRWLLPGIARQLKQKPTAFVFRHSITHHDIYVTPVRKKGRRPDKDWQWVPVRDIAEWIPASLVKKTLHHSDIHV
ncbi:MAG: A/G-specific adenine glycosylase [Bdellovibrionaceae bacterium]|nr:A/G-specific adenine glycosylase [Bdellovibrionales bacterium]MCB9084906.1 A/G-specific adenine glycosylase [Pseudobdellovibrionaceae bacterium]